MEETITEFILFKGLIFLVHETTKLWNFPLLLGAGTLNIYRTHAINGSGFYSKIIFWANALWCVLPNFICTSLVLGRPKAGRVLRFRLKEECICCRQKRGISPPKCKELDSSDYKADIAVNPGGFPPKFKDVNKKKKNQEKKRRLKIENERK